MISNEDFHKKVCAKLSTKSNENQKQFLLELLLILVTFG